MGPIIVISVIIISVLCVIAVAVAHSKYYFACGNCIEKFPPQGVRPRKSKKIRLPLAFYTPL